MLKPKLFIIQICLLFPCFGFAQQSIGYRDFRSVDSLSRSIEYENDIYKLTKDLTDPFPEQLLKVRAIFIWITEHISYDYKFINKEQMIKDRENNYIKSILKKKKGICDGYARLFKRMCDIAGIRSEIIQGYT